MWPLRCLLLCAEVLVSWRVVEVGSSSVIPSNSLETKLMNRFPFRDQRTYHVCVWLTHNWKTVWMVYSHSLNNKFFLVGIFTNADIFIIHRQQCPLGIRDIELLSEPSVESSCSGLNCKRFPLGTYSTLFRMKTIVNSRSIHGIGSCNDICFAASGSYLSPYAADCSSDSFRISCEAGIGCTELSHVYQSFSMMRFDLSQALT